MAKGWRPMGTLRLDGRPVLTAWGAATVSITYANPGLDLAMYRAWRPLPKAPPSTPNAGMEDEPDAHPSTRNAE